MKRLALAFLISASTSGLIGCSSTPVAVKPLPVALHGHRMHLLNGNLYVLGGYGSQGSMTSTTMLDPESRQWVKRTDMNVPKTFFASVNVNGLIYAIGSTADDDDLSVIEQYDPTTNRWTIVLVSKRLPRTHFSAAAVGELIYIIGGFPDTTPHMHVFNTRTRNLTDALPLPDFHRGDHFHYMAEIDGKLHVLGGMRFEPDTAVLDQHWMLDGETWKKRAPLPHPALSKLGTYGVIDGKLYVFSKTDDIHHAYDARTDQWSDTPTAIPITVVMSAAIVEGQKLHVFGGMRPGTDLGKQTVLTFDVDTNTWTTTR